MEQAQGSPTPEVVTQEPSQGTPEQKTQSQAQAKQSAAAAEAEALYELVVDGKTRKLNKQQMIVEAQKGLSAESRYSEAAQMRKEAAAQAAELKKIISNAKTNPIAALMDPAMGLTKDQIRDAFEQWYNREYIEPESLSPEKLELRNAKEQLQKYKEMEEAQAKAKADAEAQEMTARELKYFQEKIIAAMDAGNFPRTKEAAARVAFYIKQARDEGWDAPTDVIVHQVKSEETNRVKNLITSSSVEQLVEIFGADTINKIRAWDLQQLRQKKAALGSTPSQKSSPSPEKHEKLTYNEVQARLNKMRQGRL